VPDPELEALATAIVNGLEAAERSVDRLDADGTLAEAEAVRVAVIAAEVRQLDVAVHWADLHAVLTPPPAAAAAAVAGRRVPGGERLVRLGGDGTPEIAEFAVAELAVSLRISDNAAAALIGDALDLRHRFPLLWDHLHHHRTPVWMARKTAQASRHLTATAAGSVDRQVATHHGHLTWARLRKAVDAAILRADPPQALSDAEQAAADAGITYRPDDMAHGYGTMLIRAAAGDLHAFHQALDIISRAMKILGDPRTANQRRAAAIAILAHPDTAKTLIERAQTVRETQTQAAATRRAGHSHSHSPGSTADNEPADTAERATAAEADQAVMSGMDRGPLVFGRSMLYLHLTHDTLQNILNSTPNAAADVGRVEDIGPVIADQIRQWLAHTNVTVKPVLDLAGIAPVDRYEVPPRITEAIGLIHPADYSPYASSTHRAQDHDHVNPYLPRNKGGPPSQTDPLTMGKLTRRHHRTKTHAGWTVTTLHPGTWLWRTPHGRLLLVDHHGTTPLPTR
jgi:hypothetical protein